MVTYIEESDFGQDTLDLLGMVGILQESHTKKEMVQALRELISKATSMKSKVTAAGTGYFEVNG